MKMCAKNEGETEQLKGAIELAHIPRRLVPAPALPSAAGLLVPVCTCMYIIIISCHAMYMPV